MHNIVYQAGTGVAVLIDFDIATQMRNEAVLLRARSL
jgi:hypothetical protein